MCLSETNSVFLFFSSISQEVILKRAADLVEALYGLPHNNQVRNTHTHTHANNHEESKKKEDESVILAVMFMVITLLCFPLPAGDHSETCGGHCRSALQRSTRTHPALRLHPQRHDGGQLLHRAAVCQRLRTHTGQSG